MATIVELANRALTICGAQRITSRTDPSKSGRAVDTVYDGVRDSCLAIANWKFALRRFQPQSSTAPLFEWAYAYVIPDQILRLVEIRDLVITCALGARYLDQPTRVFEVEENKRILTNFAAPLNCRGVARITDESRFDPLFNDFFIEELALAMWEDVSRKSATKKSDLEQSRNRRLRIARARDCLLEPPEELPDESWFLSRVGP
jgi:hypothetical protein